MVMQSISWPVIGFVWGFSLIFMFIQDAAKVANYRLQARLGYVQDLGTIDESFLTDSAIDNVDAGVAYHGPPIGVPTPRSSRRTPPIQEEEEEIDWPCPCLNADRRDYAGYVRGSTTFGEGDLPDEVVVDE